MRQIVLDTETTGLEADAGHRIIEIGCIELVNRRATPNRFHRYVNPERDIDEGALAVHGISRAQLAKEPRFGDIAAELLAFLGDAELIIHNAAFDLKFLDAEFARGKSLAGQRNNLDALCKRYSVDNSRRELHGALLDAQLLAEVYLAMTGGQGALALGEARAASITQDVSAGGAQRVERPKHLKVVQAGRDERRAHEALLAKIETASGKPSIWATAETPG
jgi:DNA polymerase III subunit epsilon